MDFATLGGLIFSLGCILGGQALEGGHAGSLMQLTAFIIVLGGTIGAVSVGSPPALIKDGAAMIKLALFPPKDDTAKLTGELLELATLARKEGVLALEPKLAELEDPFFKRALQMIVDGVDRAVTRDILEADAIHAAKSELAAAKLWEQAGGYSPTVGILGAVLGLIHVMENLSDPSKLGGGIATAFVATVYGVGTANLFFLPVANKLKLRIQNAKDRKILVIEAALGIQEGLPTSVLAEKLTSYGGKHEQT